jgi:hypothetical protein
MTRTVTEAQRAKARARALDYWTPERRAKARQARLEYMATAGSRYPQAAAAYAEFQRMVNAGEIAKGPCSHCGTTERVAAVVDYVGDPLRPVFQEWACYVCRPNGKRGHYEEMR